MTIVQNNIRISWRNLWRNKTFSLINVAGLALGIAVFLLIMEYVAYEWSANRFHKNFTQLYRASVFHDKDIKGDYLLAPGITPVIKANFPEVSRAVRVVDGLAAGVVSSSANNGVTAFREKNISFADSDFFKVFSFKIIAGNDNALQRPQALALSATKAKKYFGDADAIGKVLTVSNQFGTTNYTVSAVFEDMPQQSDIKADILLSLKTLEDPAHRNQNDWADPNGTGSGFTFTYLLLNKGTDAERLAGQITAYFHRILPDSKKDRLGLQPMKDLHLAPIFTYNYQTYGSLVSVMSLLSAAVLILIIAWVNYINLSTAQALKRAREIGVRKILGAGKLQVIALQLTETALLMLLSITAAIFIVKIIQPLYNSFTGHTLSLMVLSNGWFSMVALALIVMGTFAAGGYVAAILSSFDPLKTIRNTATITIGGISLRKSLVVFQFAVSIIFTICTITLYRQLNFMQHQDLGFKADQLLVINGPSVDKASRAERTVAFANQLKALPFVKKIASSNNVPGNGYNFSTQGITRINPKPGDEKKGYNMLIVNDRYFDTFNIKIKEGIAFTNEMTALGWNKSKKVMINEAAVKQLGFESNRQAVGKKIKWDGDYEVVGVVRDYHHMSLHTLIEPMIFLPAVGSSFFTVQLGGNNTADNIRRIRTTYQSTFPGEPFDYSFVDEAFNNQYRDEYKMGQLFVSAAGVAVFIACLGLFGLAAYAAKQRTKEIGVRKVLGASVAGITAILSKDFIKLVIIAVFIASPISWLLINKWLEGFAYRAPVQWWIFLVAGGITTFIAFATISYQSVKAAMANPAKSLKME